MDSAARLSDTRKSHHLVASQTQLSFDQEWWGAKTRIPVPTPGSLQWWGSYWAIHFSLVRWSSTLIISSGSAGSQAAEVYHNYTVKGLIFESFYNCSVPRWRTTDILSVYRSVYSENFLLAKWDDMWFLVSGFFYLASWVNIFKGHPYHSSGY